MIYKLKKAVGVYGNQEIEQLEMVNIFFFMEPRAGQIEVAIQAHRPSGVLKPSSLLLI
jgi:hypothetical protein